jgi:hypothetical protein
MSILQNAIDSIQLGVEDFETHNAKRLPSSVRNFFAGVMLLFKHKLAELSADDDEALIKQKVLPVWETSQVIWKGKGRKTVDFIQIQERFTSLGIEVDWKKLEEIQSYRNDIEHYHTDVKPEAVRQYLVDGFVIVRDFIDRYLHSAPRELLGEDTWSVLVDYEEVYKAEARSCSDRIDALEWSNETAHKWISAATCDKCLSRLIRPRSETETKTDDLQFECSVCGQHWTRDELLEIAGSPHFDEREIKDGGEYPVGQCPECASMGYDSIEEQCAFCGTRGPYECARCGSTIPTGELNWDEADLCAFCAHMVSKDD